MISYKLAMRWFQDQQVWTVGMWARLPACCGIGIEMILAGLESLKHARHLNSLREP
jgi:hypothetical protein